MIAAGWVRSVDRGHAPAEAGEFTRRAFETALDLTAVEACRSDGAETEAQAGRPIASSKGCSQERETWRAE